MMDYQRVNGAADGGATFVISTDDETLGQRLKRAANQTPTETPTPSNGDNDGGDGGGPVERFTSAFSDLGMGALEAVGLDGHEIADAVHTRVQELYRNEFPVLKPRFERKCEVCGTEYDERVETCQEPDCEGSTREPDAAEKRHVQQLLQSVNKEGQSLRAVGQDCEWDQWLQGVPVLVLRHAYRLERPSPTDTVREVIQREVEEIITGDPKRIVPVVDENRRIGGYWWACPVCRHKDNYEPSETRGVCDDCAARLREVYFTELDDDGDPDSYYFKEEIITFPWAYPRLHGLDGLAPVHHIWLKQLIIDAQDAYAGAFYDPNSERLPNQFIVLHTTNPDAWEARLQEARENAKDDEYDSPVFANEYSPQDDSTPEVQVVDTMPDELLGQNEQLKDTFKKDIRQAIGIADVFDSDLQEAGGLNNEGLQIEVTDRSIASQQHDYVEGWLDTLAKRLGIDDWYIAYIPSTGPDAQDLREEVEAGMTADQAGLDARIEDGQTEIADGEFDVPAQQAPAADGGGPGDFQAQAMTPNASGRETDGSSHDFGPTVDAAGGEDLSQATDLLYQAHQHMVEPDLVDQKASQPFWDDDESMPEFVRRLVEKALDRNAIQTVSKHLPPSVTPLDVRDFFAEKLDQPQGWSLESLTEDYADRFGVGEGEAEQAVRRQTKSVLDKGREIGYEQQADVGDGDDEPLFKWVGPIDDDKTDASWEVLEKTNPDHGGTPRPLDELKAIVQEARRRHFPELTGAEWADSWQDRDTFVMHFD